MNSTTLQSFAKPDGYHVRSGWYAGFRLHRLYLRQLYPRSYAQVQQLGRDPLALPQPRVLLCGTGSAQTTLEFASFVFARNPAASLHVLDLSEVPLQASSDLLEQKGFPRAQYIQANALETPFAEDAFDLVETDFFLQFFDHAAKQRLAREWARLLAPGVGALMTRDYVREDDGGWMERQLDSTRQRLFRRTLHTETHSTTRSALAGCFTEAGLRCAIQPVRRGVPLVKLIAAAW